MIAGPNGKCRLEQKSQHRYTLQFGVYPFWESNTEREKMSIDRRRRLLTGPDEKKDFIMFPFDRRRINATMNGFFFDGDNFKRGRFSIATTHQ